jgi:AAHS family 3-hydroxyphenylpropionic acid transporter
MTAVTVTDRAAGIRMTLLLCTLAALCEGIDLQAAGVAAAGISAEFHPSAQAKGWFFSASTLGLFFGALFGGRMADRVGRKGVLVSSIAIFGVFSLLTPLAWDVATLTLARLLTGLGLGGALPNLVALVSESSAEHRRSANVGLIYSGTPVGGALASLVSLLSAAAHWRWIFIAGGVLPLVLAPIMAVLLRESTAFQRQRAAAERDTRLITKAGSFSQLLADGRALRSALLWVSFLLALLTLYLLLNWLPTLMVSNGLGKAQAAGAQIGFNLGGALAALLIGYLLEGRLRRGSVVVASIAVPVLLAVLANTPAQVGPVVVVVTLLGCAIIATQAFMYAMAPACYPTFIRGVGVGTAVAIGRVGSILGPAVAGVLVGAGASPTRLLLELTPLALVGAVGAIAVERMVPAAQPMVPEVPLSA